MGMEQRILEEQGRLRREVLTSRILDGLRTTIQLQGITPETPVDEVRALFTEASVQFIAPLVEAVGILEAIIFASDGCRGHAKCLHSMEPWQRARALLQGKWEADTGERESWPDLPKRT